MEPFTLRAAVAGDMAAVLALLRRCETAEYGEPDTGPEDLHDEWAQLDLSRDAWVALAADSQVVGYAAVMPWSSGLRYELHLAPEWPDPAPGRALLARCRARVQNGSRPRPVTVRTYIAHVNLRDRNLVTEAGFQLTRHHFQMLLRFADRPEGIPAPVWPAGIQVRTAVPGRDDEAIHTLVEAAFARPGRRPKTVDEWRERMTGSAAYDPGLWFVAQAEDSLAGVCLCFDYSEGGWVRQLAVAQSWRRRGLGTALLRHAFLAFQARGHDNVGLGVEAGNRSALQLYEQAGMRLTRQYDEYQTTVD